MSTAAFRTRVLKLDPLHFSPSELSSAAELIREGEIVGFPTETVYGLGASAFSKDAVLKIFQAKGRPGDNPLIVHISSMDMLLDLVREIPENARQLCGKFWPGPLTIIFPKSEKVPFEVTAGLQTVAVRMPSHLIAHALIKEAGVPIAAPSANLSGRPSPTRASDVLQDLDGKIPLIIDGGACEVGLESTVIDLNSDPPLILRPGGITLEQLREWIPRIQVYEKIQPIKELEERPSTPGLKYTHYSPRAKVMLFEGSIKAVQDGVERMCLDLLKQGSTIGIIHTIPSPQANPAFENNPKVSVIHLISQDSLNKSRLLTQPALIAKGLFAALRDLDKFKVDVILVEGIPETNEGLAVMNRLRKAASEIFRFD
jgi:L-threonylcarbamoyladenylate synthase